MGLDLNGTADLAQAKGSGSFGATASGAAVAGLIGDFNVVLGGSGWVATITLQESYDNGATWIASSGGVFTTPGARVARNNEAGVLHRLDCVYTSGTIPWRLSGGPRQ